MALPTLSGVVGRLENRYPYETLRYVKLVVELLLLLGLLVVLVSRPGRAESVLAGRTP